MEEIYINTTDPLDPGDIGIGEICETGQPPFIISVRCIREATFEEYFAWVEKLGMGRFVNRDTFDGHKFYLVEVLD